MYEHLPWEWFTQGGPKKTIPKLTKMIQTLMIFLVQICTMEGH